jgi:hypothetical protein
MEHSSARVARDNSEGMTSDHTDPTFTEMIRLCELVIILLAEPPTGRRLVL